MKQLIIMFLLCAAGVGGYKAYQHFAPDDKKIIWVIEDLADAFNQADVNGCLRAFHTNWVDESMKDSEGGVFRADKGLVMTAFPAFFAARTNQDKTFLYKAGILEDGRVVQVHSRENAQVEFDMELRVHEGVRFSAEPVWQAKIRANMGVENGRWVILSSKVERLSGNRPSL